MESGVNRVAKPWFAVISAFVCLAGSAFAQAPAQTPATVTVLGQIEKVEAATRTVHVKTEEGSTLTITLAEKGTVVKVAPGEKSLTNAAPIAFDAIATGDRVMIRGGVRTDAKVEGALRIVVMAKTDLAARNEEEQRAWRERGIAGTVTAVDPAKGEFSIHVSGAPASAAPGSPAAAPTATPTVTVEAAKATLHRYADTSVKFDDAKPATVKDVAVGDQARLLGKRSEDGSRITADKVVFGSFKTMALAIEKVDPATGVLSVKDLETNQKFTLSVVPGATIRKIPTEMAAMFAMMGGGGGRPGMGGGAGMAGGAGRGDRAGGGQPNPGGTGMGGQSGQGGPGGRPGGPGRGGRMEDMVERLPAITIADLKKDDWIGAVVGKTDASGRAVAFNMLAGIEAFASRANRSGGVDVGMPAGLLDGALGVP
jgi:hypothetical protein